MRGSARSPSQCSRIRITGRRTHSAPGALRRRFSWIPTVSSGIMDASTTNTVTRTGARPRPARSSRMPSTTCWRAGRSLPRLRKSRGAGSGVAKTVRGIPPSKADQPMKQARVGLPGFRFLAGTTALTLAFVLAGTWSFADKLDGAARKDKEPVTYAKQVARILQDHCQTCHHPGTAAPFALLTYEDA